MSVPVYVSSSPGKCFTNFEYVDHCMVIIACAQTSWSRPFVNLFDSQLSLHKAPLFLNSAFKLHIVSVTQLTLASLAPSTMESEEEPFTSYDKPWENEDYGTLKMTMSDLKQFITKSMMEVCADPWPQRTISNVACLRCLLTPYALTTRKASWMHA